MKNATELLGGRIRELRKAQGLTQEQLADSLGIEQKHVSLIELGKSYPSLDRLMRIAEVLKVPLPNLFDFTHLEPEAVLPDQMLENMKGVDERDRQLLYRITEWMKER
jgi:transcriptional regulator with XRE-family HTH domain